MFNQIKSCVVRQLSTKAKLKVIPNEDVLKNIENNVYKPKQHPGIVKISTIVLPDKFIEAAKNVIQDYPMKTIISDATKLHYHLKGRVPPMEPEQINELKDRVYESILRRETKKVKTEEETETVDFKVKVKNKVVNILKQKVYNWTPMTYDAYNSLVYLYSRSAAEYAVMVKIFAEICKRDADFKPRSLFDFGSGIGTVTWASNVYWKNNIFEYYNVDSSSFMNDLAQMLLQNGRGTKQMSLKGVYYRQFLPSNNRSYDIVVSAYSLLELPSNQTRLETILKLWNKTEKYLILVEQGTNGGFRVINEARDFILSLNEGSTCKGHVFSPCPHDSICPRFLLDDNTPCNFEVVYNTSMLNEKAENKREFYTYVVLKKGERDPNEEPWPRVVRETLIRPKHTICRICTTKGNLEEVIFTASKHGKSTYHCARSTKWGDRLPIALEELETTDKNEVHLEKETSPHVISKE